MRLGLNILYLIPGQVGGTETYAKEFIQQLSNFPDHQYTLYCTQESAPLFTPLPYLKIRAFSFSARNRILRLLVEQLVLPIYIWLDHLDAIFSLGYSSPWLSPCPSVVTIHDLNWYFHPEDFSPINRLIWQLVTKISAATSSYIITDSVASARSLEQVLRIPHSRLSAILHAAPTIVKMTPTETKARLKKMRVTTPYIFTVVANYPHKNINTLIKAFNKLQSDFPKLQLIICGLGKHNINYGSNIKVMGYVDRLDLVALYSGASVFVFPSAYEGFGYPPLEAMSYQTPVVSSNSFSLKEVVSKGGILVEPYDICAYCNAIQSILQNSSVKNQLIHNGKDRLKLLSWHDTVSATLKHITKVI